MATMPAAADGRDDPADPDGFEHLRIAPSDAGIEHQQKAGKQDQHDEQVEQTLEHDGGERGGDAQALLASQHERPDELTRARRQDQRHGKADDRCTKRCAEPRLPNRPEKVLPPDRAEHVREHRETERISQPVEPSLTRGGPDLVEPSLPEEPGHQGNREGQKQDCSDARPHHIVVWFVGHPQVMDCNG